jgi:hypothetical protein
MRTHLALFASVVLFAGACGGQVTGSPGNGSSSGGGSGSSSGGGGSGGSGGGSGGVSSSGVSSSSGSTGSGSGSSGPGCEPLPGCDSTVECPAGDGCNTCYCENGVWACGDLGCVSDGGISIEAGGACPEYPPQAGSYCDVQNVSCGWSTGQGCGESCYCNGNEWACSEDPCVGPTCPANPPPSGGACSAIGTTCDWGLNGVCGEYECQCDPSGTWGCYDTDCFDGGEPDDGGISVDASEGPCPASQPAESSACTDDGLVCTYNACPTNCLCASGAWVCAAQQGCP